MIRRRKWDELTSRQQTAVLVAASVELSLTATALVDLARRPAAEVRGSRGWWFLGLFVQPVGPVAYLLYGRRPR